MTTSSEAPVGDFASDLAALRQDIAHLIETMSNMVQHQKQVAGGHVLEAVGDARGKLASAAADAQKSVRAAGSAIEGGIERHPLKSTLIALCVGLSLGVLSRRRV